MKFTRAYTANQLNHGEGMTFHPISGELLSTLEFADKGCVWCRYIFVLRTGWETPEPPREYLKCITGGKKLYAVGDRYPQHWRFDPFTGGRLIEEKAERDPCTIKPEYVPPNLDYESVQQPHSRWETMLIRAFVVLFAAFIVLQLVLLFDLLLRKEM